jgi:uncharacterized protein (TIGR00375 family)
MLLFADLHIHSKYAYATSKFMDLQHIAAAAKAKGIGILATGDFTHPLWFKELKAKLRQTGEGTFSYEGIYFCLNVEVSNIYRRNGRVYKVHNLVFAPDLSAAEKLNKKFAAYGKLASDGRPILKLDSEEMVRMVLDISGDCMVVPSHAWTPHFGVFGSASGFDSFEECFGAETRHIHAIETGLSSDPAMNWRVSALDRITLISNSDAHSAANLGREVNAFDIKDPSRLYEEIASILKTKDPARFLCTVEFFPEEGKYHFDGCRLCGERMEPAATIRHGGRCPKCGRPATIGVLHRVEKLADRKEGVKPAGTIPYKRLLQLNTVIAEALGVGKTSKRVGKIYETLVGEFGSELNVLLNVPEKELQHIPEPRVAAAILKMRNGDVDIQPGYDGEYGTVRIRW